MQRIHSLIIGGTSGIGSVLVKTLAEENHLLSVIGLQLPNTEDQLSPNIHYWPVNLLDCNDLVKVLREIIRQRGKINNLIFSLRYRGDEDDWQNEIQLILTTTKNIIENMINEFKGQGSIVVINSKASHLVAAEQPLSYHVTRAGLAQIVRYYACILGEKNIRVNSVSPGTVLKAESKVFYETNNQLYNLYKRITPLGRMGTSEDVANVVSFLCSAKASFITSQDIVVDGGLSAQLHETMANEVSAIVSK